MGNAQQKQNKRLVGSEKTEEAEGSTFTCEICMESFSSVHKFNNNNRCIHPFCVDCLIKYVQAKIKDDIADIQCPALKCKQWLDPSACQAIITRQLFNKWCDRLCEASLLVLNKCYCPNKTCSAVIINECGESVEKTKCLMCKKIFCFKCKVPWHAGFWCDETRQRKDANDVAFGMLLEKNKWNRCPACGQAIELLSGCPWVKCRYFPTPFSNPLKHCLQKIVSLGESNEKLHK